MNEPHSPESVDLRQYLTVLRARKWSIFLVTALVIGTALFFSYRQTPMYKAESRILVKSLPTSPTDFYALPPNMETESEVVQSAPVAEIVAEDLAYDGSTDALLGGLDASFPTDSDVLILQYTSEDPIFAAAAANSFAESYVNFRRESALRQLEGAQKDIQSRISTVQKQLTGVIEGITKAQSRGDQSEVAALETERSTLTARLGILQQRLDDLQPDRSIELGAGEVLKTAAVPGAPFSPNHIRNGLLAAFLGLALGMGLAFLRERLEDRIRDQADLERAVGAPLLATIPPLPGSPKEPESRVVVVNDPRGLASESYRGLRTNLQFMAAQGSAKSVLVTSPAAGDGKTVTTANLGAALASAGKKVVIVSADLRKPTLGKLFGLDSRDTGLSLRLADQEPPDTPLVRPTAVDRLSIVMAGPIPPNPAELLNSPRLAQLLLELEEDFDYVLVDSPPTLAVADASIIASRVGGVILVLGGEAHRSSVVQARQAIERVGGTLLGAVVNGLEPTGTGYRYYYAKNYYGEGAAQEGADLDEAKGLEGRRARRAAKKAQKKGRFARSGK